MKTYILTAQINRTLRLSILFCLMLLGASCNGLVVASTPSPTPLPSFTPTVEEEATEVSDCLWKANGKAWKDDNQDGVWNSGEKPLANVKFWVDDTLNDYEKVNEFLSDTVATNSDGKVEISVWLPGCPEVEFEVYTEAPQNCRLTTQERLPVNLDSQYPVYSFGFVCQ
jgi:hypothetical protein